MKNTPATPEPATAGRWRPSALRLLVMYGAFFLLWSIVLIGAIRWQTTQYIDRIVGDILEQRAHFLASVERERLPELMAATNRADLRNAMYSGLFDARGAYVVGNIDKALPNLPTDGVVHSLAQGLAVIDGRHDAHALGVALRLPSGETLVLARVTGVAEHLSTMMRDALLWTLSLLAIPGLIGGWLLSRGPLRRVREMEIAVAPIARGDLAARLPLSPRRDELDMLARIVNRMLDEVERLLGEIKGATDGIAHDLRTPLTRLRAQLYRARLMSAGDDPRGELLECCIGETEALLDRFSALLRISELEDLRRQAGFDQIDAADTLRRVHELYAPLAEEKSLALELAVPDTAPLIADATLLFEALGNLVDNAIKFTPPQGRVELVAGVQPEGVRIDVLDSGPGVPADERSAVLYRFYRGRRTRDESEGHGLGLSLVAAIARLHGFCFEIGDSPGGGARMTLYCWPCSNPGGRAVAGGR